VEKLSRRKLITQTSVGVGAVGVLAVAAACNTSNTTSDTDLNLSTNVANAVDDPLAIFVTDPAKGTLKVMKGDLEIVIDNPSLAQSLLAIK
jgi:hypothetical protein